MMKSEKDPVVLCLVMYGFVFRVILCFLLYSFVTCLEMGVICLSTRMELLSTRKYSSLNLRNDKAHTKSCLNTEI